MRRRTRVLGNRNMVGERVTKARLEKKMLQKDLLAKLQVAGVDISLDSLSQLEGKRRPVFDFELFTIAKILGKEIGWFFEDEKEDEL